MPGRIHHCLPYSERFVTVVGLMPRRAPFETQPSEKRSRIGPLKRPKSSSPDGAQVARRVSRPVGPRRSGRSTPIGGSGLASPKVKFGTISSQVKHA